MTVVTFQTFATGVFVYDILHIQCDQDSILCTISLPVRAKVE